MDKMQEGEFMNRRSFIRLGAASFAAAAGSAKSLIGGTRVERLRFGVVSDVHIASASDTCALWEKALRFYSTSSVDAVLVAGDISDNGLLSELKKAGDVWRRVFPNNRRRDGGLVEKVFVTGNHDIDGWRYGAAKKKGITAEKDGANIIDKRVAECWREAFDEDYAPMYLKEIKGYHFVGTHYVKDNGYLKDGAIAEFLNNHRQKLEGGKPFFYVQHYHPKGTCSAPWVWGQDDGFSTAALSSFPNAVAFSGHSHTPLTDERTLWRGAFTSIGTASLRYLIPFGGRENSHVFGESANGGQQMPSLKGREAQHGQLVTVYDDCIVIERRDFTNGKPVAPDWIVPIPSCASSFEERGHNAKIPEFEAGAKVDIKRVTGKNRANKSTDQFVVSFPNVRSNPKGVHAFDFRVVVEVEDVDSFKVWATKRVYSPHFYWAGEKDDPIVTCVFSCQELPRANRVPTVRGRRFRFAVAPANCFGGHGAEIHSAWITGNFGERSRQIR